MVYLIHFARPISDRHTCQHYIGWTPRSADERLADHRSGNGARLTQVANERGIPYEIVRTWDGDRTLERRLKNWHNSPELCPICAARRKEPKCIK